MKILNVSAECYPAAKAGGLGDVVGALPKYLNQAKLPTSVIIPKYHTKWILQQKVETVFDGQVQLGSEKIPFSIELVRNSELGFPLYLANIPGKFDRAGVYGAPGGGWYTDEPQRFISFQLAILQWLLAAPEKPALIHCHDHHVGLLPFLIKHATDFAPLKETPTVFTIHNGAYHGAFSWEHRDWLPAFPDEARGFLDWSNSINPLAAAIKCAWRVTTVSPSYLDELKHRSNGMESLIYHEQHKSLGILNGIDIQVWDPSTDPFLEKQLKRSIKTYKKANKTALTKRFQVEEGLPIITFIGRLVGEKGADLLPDLISRVLRSGLQVGFILLGTGEPHLHTAFQELANEFPGKFGLALEYNEGLAHQLYAGSDFLIMPSRVEPCGLNQLYAMRYATVPIVRSVGGLRDTVLDIDKANGSGSGIRFDQFNLDDGHIAIYRAVALYKNTEAFEALQKRIAKLDFSWEKSAQAYMNIYQEMI